VCSSDLILKKYLIYMRFIIRVFFINNKSYDSSLRFPRFPTVFYIAPQQILQALLCTLPFPQLTPSMNASYMVVTCSVCSTFSFTPIINPVVREFSLFFVMHTHTENY